MFPGNKHFQHRTDSEFISDVALEKAFVRISVLRLTHVTWMSCNLRDSTNLGNLPEAVRMLLLCSQYEMILKEALVINHLRTLSAITNLLQKQLAGDSWNYHNELCLAEEYLKNSSAKECGRIWKFIRCFAFPFCLPRMTRKRGKCLPHVK